MLLGYIVLFGFTAKGQFIDHYGLKIGAGLSSQHWEFKKDRFSNLTQWKDNKVGLIGQFYAEKNINKFLSLRPAIGYLQKGFIDDIVLINADGEELGVKDNRVIFHDVSLDVALKIIPLDKKVKPYLLLGLRGDYLLDYRSVIIDFQGEELEMNTDLYDDFNTFTLGAIFGVGISYNDIFFLDVEYNPALTKNIESDGLAIKDRYIGLTLGIQVNRLIKSIRK